MKKVMLFALGLVCMCPTLAIAQPGRAASTPAQASTFVAGLDDLVESLRSDFGRFGMALAVIERGRIVGERYYGFADAERRIPMSRSTLVNVASVSKAVSAFGVMRLADRKRIGLDEPVFGRITRWRLPPSEFPVSEVTAARLLSHTAGISRHTTGTWTVDDRLPTLEAALSGDNGGYGDTRLILKPGTKWSYSGGGYSILQMLVEEVTGKRFSEYMNSEVLPGLGIRNSWFGWPPQVERASAVYYDEFGRPVPAYRTIEEAAGAFNANAADLARFALAFSDVRDGKWRPALSKALMARMTAPAPAAEVGPDARFGLGLLLQRLPDGRTIISHDGGNPGSGAFFAIHPETGNGIVVLVNRSWAGQVFFPIACEWRNSTAPQGAPPQQCNRDPVGILINTLATRGLEAARVRYEAYLAENPQRVGEQQIFRMARQLNYADRHSDAAAVLRWHIARNPHSAAAHDRLGDALLSAGDLEGARNAWEASLRISPDQAEVRKKLAG